MSKNKTTHEICKEALERFKPTTQKIKALEELSELQAVIARDINQIEILPEEIIDELADVWLMTQQMAILYGEEAVLKRIEEKTERLRIMIECKEINCAECEICGEGSCAALKDRPKETLHCPSCAGCICCSCMYDSYENGSVECCHKHRNDKTCEEWMKENKCPDYIAEKMEK